MFTQICNWHNRLYLETYEWYIRFEKLCRKPWHLALIWYLADVCSFKIALVIFDLVKWNIFPNMAISKYGYFSWKMMYSLAAKITQQKCIRWLCVTWLKSAVNEILSTKCEVALKLTPLTKLHLPVHTNQDEVKKVCWF